MRSSFFTCVLLAVAAQSGCVLFPKAQTQDVIPVLGPTGDRLPPPKNLAEKDPREVAQARFSAAEALDRGEKVPEAIALYEQARIADPRLANKVSRRLAVLYDQFGEWDQARLEYERLLKANPKDADMWTKLGHGYYLRRHFTEAEQCHRQAIAVNPKHGAAWINLGLTLAQMERYSEAFEATATIIPPAQAHCNMAFVLTTQGKREEAKKRYRDALALDPSMQKARQALEKLENPAPVAKTSKDARPPISTTLPEIDPEATKLVERLAMPVELPPLFGNRRPTAPNATPASAAAQLTPADPTAGEEQSIPALPPPSES